MVLYLRDKKDTIVDIEIFKAREEQHDYVDIRCSIDIVNYSIKLLSMNSDDQIQFINYIDELSEISGWLWEVYFMGKKNDNHHNYEDILEQVKNTMGKVAEKFGLIFITD